MLRGSLIYVGLLLISRIMARRRAGQFGPADLLLIVMIADAAQNGLGQRLSVHSRRSGAGGGNPHLRIIINWLRFRIPRRFGRSEAAKRHAHQGWTCKWKRYSHGDTHR
jgi:hypothetical protein